MNAYRVTYRGLWLGGTAIVLAESEHHAVSLVQADSLTVNFTSVKVSLVTEDLDNPRVLENDNGDY